ncbi:SirA family protein [Ferroglobus placidus DSM 10642]|uniref:SirA family protein n=1 Tax=Ferroglobus placidus (strain DSM 10642 / AEDII12DO) TaxID=589924 RepID=D3S0U5_FERPA|nr:sulfurtransferase TusA family protein [Ferroglobus placidus]ADC66336.1 SirA family protein [Ferroglobus placidus DSM 10642]
MITLDLRGEVCPFTFVKTKVKLEELKPGELLEVILDHEPAVRDVPRSVEAEGHEVLSVEKIGDKEWRIVIRKR